MSNSTDLTKKRTQALKALATTAPLTPTHLIELLAAASKAEKDVIENELTKARVDAQEWQQSAESYEMLYVKALERAEMYKKQSMKIADELDREKKTNESLQEDNMRKAAYIGDMAVKVLEMQERIERIRKREDELGLPPKDL